MTKKRKKKGTWKKLMPRALVMTSLTTRASIATRCRMDGRFSMILPLLLKNWTP
jgi:hypothetical protein